MTEERSMTEEEFYRSALDFLAERLGPDAAGITPQTELVESGLLDSLMILEFFFFLETVRGGAIPPQEATVETISTLTGAYSLAVTR